MQREDAVGRHQGNRVQDVDERREHVTVEVTAQSRPDRCHYRDDRNGHAEIVEGVLRDLVHDETSPIEAHAAVDGHEYDGSRCRHLLSDAEQQSEHAEETNMTVITTNNCNEYLCKKEVFQHCQKRPTQAYVRGNTVT